MNEDQLYYKEGRRYKPAHTTIRQWFPEDGVWLVTGGGQSARQLGSGMPDPIRLASFHRHYDVVCRVLGELRNACPADQASAVLEVLESKTRP